MEASGVGVGRIVDHPFLQRGAVLWLVRFMKNWLHVLPVLLDNYLSQPVLAEAGVRSAQFTSAKCPGSFNLNESLYYAPSKICKAEDTLLKAKGRVHNSGVPSRSETPVVSVASRFLFLMAIIRFRSLPWLHMLLRTWRATGL